MFGYKVFFRVLEKYHGFVKYVGLKDVWLGATLRHATLWPAII
jgi:hypothetical protein